jgi:hypothetical protein
MLRTASYACPCSERRLKNETIALVRVLATSDEVHELVENAFQAHLDHGNLLQTTGDSGDEIRLRAPSALKIDERTVLILGGLPNGAEPLPLFLRSSLIHRGPARLLKVESSDRALSDLLAGGFIVIGQDEWANLPQIVAPQRLVESYARRFRNDVPVGEIAGLRILDTHKPVLFYKGRWTSQINADGLYVARRERRYGADSWCLIQIKERQPQSLVDLPSNNFSYRACDEAWHIQMAIDALNGLPQLFRLTQESSEAAILEFYSPIPQWAHQRWSLTGEFMIRPGCLFAYKFSPQAVQQQIDFAKSRMWLAPR